MAQQVVDGEGLRLGLHAAGVEPRNIQQAGQQAFGGNQGAVDVRECFAVRAVFKPRRQCVHEQVRRVQRLRQVVADRGQESRLAAVGAFGFGLGAGQLRGAFGHALFQGFGDRLEFGLAAPEVGDVGEGGDESAAGHRIAADFDHHVAKVALGDVGRARTHVPQALGDLAFWRTVAGQAAADVVRHQFGHRHADLQQRRRVVEQFGVATVPGDQAQLGVHHRNALAHVFQRGFEHALVEAQRLRGFADDGGHRVEVGALGAPRRVEQQPRRGRAQHRRQFAFNALLKFAGHRLPGRGAGQHRVHARHRQETHGHFAQCLARQRAAAVGRGHIQARSQHPRHQRAGTQAQHRGAADAAPVAQAEHLLRRQPGPAQRPLLQPGRRLAAGFGQRRHQQHPAPQRHRHAQAGQHGTRRRLRSPDREGDGRRQRRQRRERQRADIGQRVRTSDKAAVAPGQQHHRQDADAALGEHRAAQVGALAATARPRAAHQQRRQPVVADHHAQRQRGQDHHAGGGAQASQEGQQRQRLVPFGQRQRQHVEVGRHADRRQQRITGARQRQDRQRDQQHVQREQPARRAQFVLLPAFDDADVELVRQREHRQRAQQHQRRETAGTVGRRRRHVHVGQVQAEHHERTQRQHRAQLQQ